MSRLTWYWHRLRAMSPSEMALHLRKKFRQHSDARRQWDPNSAGFARSNRFPDLPVAAGMPPALRKALDRERTAILAGRWKAFGHLEIQVHDPPRWDRDYLAGVDVPARQSSFKINHRRLPLGADIKLIWELSRWHPVLRLAMAAWMSRDGAGARKCLDWLEHWVEHNPPFIGWNWTSALESGMRLIQYVWIHALLTETLGCAESGDNQAFENAPSQRSRLERLTRRILPPHLCHAWRHRSFGSSANNHLLGELAGCMAVVARWPDAERYAAGMDTLQRLLEREILAQFAEDGGNREQALNYQLYSLEFCLIARAALRAIGRGFSQAVEERLMSAARFYWETQSRNDPWDFGDSDDAFVIPFFSTPEQRIPEWLQWIGRSSIGSPLTFWLGDPPVMAPALGKGDPKHTGAVGDWWVYPRAGMGVCESGFWWLRWDLSPLGYGSMAAHGHLDALHLSLWFRGVAMIIDPGTGAYYPDAPLRTWLASAAAHNGPVPAARVFPERLGTFLWSGDHAVPRYSVDAGKPLEEQWVRGWLEVPGGELSRSIRRLPDRDGWEVLDAYSRSDGQAREFEVRWQFAPGAWIKHLGERAWVVRRRDVAIEVRISEGWQHWTLVESEESARVPATSGGGPDCIVPGTVSPAFRKVEWAPFLRLAGRAGPGGACLFKTTFLASPGS